MGPGNLKSEDRLRIEVGGGEGILVVNSDTCLFYANKPISTIYLLLPFSQRNGRFLSQVPIVAAESKLTYILHGDMPVACLCNDCQM